LWLKKIKGVAISALLKVQVPKGLIKLTRKNRKQSQEKTVDRQILHLRVPLLERTAARLQVMLNTS
jgi:hypothetical protein